jgi:regulator of protease activity HflC (stomatin/prohibitin superfamily)
MAELIFGLIVALLAVVLVLRTVRIVPQARASNVERLGRYLRTLEPGLNIVIPFIDRPRQLIDLREQVVSFEPNSVITEDNLVVHIDTVLYFQVTDPRAAAYEIFNYIQAIEQLTVTTLRNVIGALDLEKTLTSREHINSILRGVLDEASGKWGIRVNRVELKAIEPPATTPRPSSPPAAARRSGARDSSWSSGPRRPCRSCGRARSRLSSRWPRPSVRR